MEKDKEKLDTTSFIASLSDKFQQVDDRTTEIENEKLKKLFGKTFPNAPLQNNPIEKRTIGESSLSLEMIEKWFYGIVKNAIDDKLKADLDNSDYFFILKALEAYDEKNPELIKKIKKLL